jgi:hypothetical protein
MTHCNEMIYQQVTLSGYAEWPKVADAVIEAQKTMVLLPRCLIVINFKSTIYKN